MAFTESDLAAVTKAIAHGHRQVQYNDRTIQYRSVSEMMDAKAAIERDLAKQSATAPPRVRPMRYTGF